MSTQQRFNITPHPRYETWHVSDTLAREDNQPRLVAICPTKLDALVVAEALTEYYARDPQRQPRQQASGA